MLPPYMEKICKYVPCILLEIGLLKDTFFTDLRNEEEDFNKFTQAYAVNLTQNKWYFWLFLPTLFLNNQTQQNRVAFFSCSVSQQIICAKAHISIHFCCGKF